MKFSSLSSRWALAFALCCGAAPALVAQDVNPPYVAKPLGDITVSATSAPTVINLKKTFALQGVTGTLVRFATSEGNVDVALLNEAAPASVANFLAYANAGSYNNSFIHRSVPGFVIQGGGYTVADNQVNTIPENAAVAGEHTVSNTRGTLAFALSTGPDSGTDQWFFNLADNSDSLDGTNDGGPFTVFGQVIGSGMTVVDAIAALKVVDASGGNTSSPFGSLPVLPSFTSGTVQLSDLVYVSSITIIPVVPKKDGDAAAVALSVKSSNPELVAPTLEGQKLTLSYGSGLTGTAVITVKAKDSAKSKIKAKFTVTVQ